MAGIVDTEGFILKIPKPETEGGFRPLGEKPLVSFETRRVGPPSDLYINRNDILQVTVLDRTGGQIIDIAGRFLRAKDGQIMQINEQHGPFSANAFNQFQIDLAEGYLLNIMARIDGTSIIRGQVFCQISMAGKKTATYNPIRVLAQNYITFGQPAYWPDGQVESSTDGSGLVVTIVGTTPLLGQEVNEFVPVNKRWRLEGFRASLVTSAAVAARVPRFCLSDGINTWGFFCPFESQAASVARGYNFGPGVTAFATPADFDNVPAPALPILAPSSRIFTLTANLDPNDQWQNVFYTVEEWVDRF